MKTIVQQKSFISGLQIVKQFVTNKATLPVLQTVKLDCSDDTLMLEATNLDASIRLKLNSNVETSGALLVDAVKLLNIVKELPNSEISLKADGQKLLIMSGGSKFKLNTMSSDDFPSIDISSNGSSITTSSQSLKSSLDRVIHASSTDENRYILNSVLLEAKEGEGLKCTATDGRRLAQSTLKENVDLNGSVNPSIIPAAFVSKKLVGSLSSGDNVTITLDENGKSALFVISDLTEDSGLIDSIMISSKLVEGRYPNYNQVVPDESGFKCAKFEKDSIFNVVRRASLVTDDKSNSVRLDFNADTLTVSGQSSSYGKASDELKLKEKFPVIAAAFNPSYMLEAIKGSASEFQLFIKDELSPALFKDDTSFEVLMPLRLT